MDTTKYEIELVCANAKAFGKTKALQMLQDYRNLKSKYPHVVTIRQSIEHTIEVPYYEASVRCVTANGVTAWLRLLKSKGIQADLVHNPDGSEIIATQWRKRS